MRLDLFAGIGGWHAVHPPAVRVAIEWDRDATLTLHELGVPVIRADIATYPAERFAGGVEGITASPPCQDWSKAGRRKGLASDRGRLVWEPLRWARAVRPRWVACEQVPDVLPIWNDIARALEAAGYRTWCGVLSAERYGVPQTRDRAILMASLDRQPAPPEPTHQEYRPGEPAQHLAGLFGDLLPWVSMAEALGWDGATEVHTNRGQTEDGARQVRPAPVPAPALTAKSGGQWHVRTGARSLMGAGVLVPYERPLVDPSPTVMGNTDRWWVYERPATTLTTDARGVPAPGHHDASEGNSQWAEGAVKLTVAEALVLQSFPADYPVQGTKTAKFRQVGNAIPPLLASAVLGQLL